MHLETHLILSQRVHLMDDASLKKLLGLSERIGQMLFALRRKLEGKL